MASYDIVDMSNKASDVISRDLACAATAVRPFTSVLAPPPSNQLEPCMTDVFVQCH